MNAISKFGAKIGSLGSVIAAMGCAGCFPALGSLAASLGLGFLASYEGLFINTLLPIFAALLLMVTVSILDVLAPPAKTTCRTLP